jgi:hypothetical protein
LGGQFTFDERSRLGNGALPFGGFVVRTSTYKVRYMDTDNNTTMAQAVRAQASREAEPRCNFRNRGLTLATFVIALAGFASTAFSAVPSEIFGQPGACIVSH